jgi:hypothetical protein
VCIRRYRRRSPIKETPSVIVGYALVPRCSEIHINWYLESPWHITTMAGAVDPATTTNLTKQVDLILVELELINRRLDDQERQVSSLPKAVSLSRNIQMQPPLPPPSCVEPPPQPPCVAPLPPPPHMAPLPKAQAAPPSPSLHGAPSPAPNARPPLPPTAPKCPQAPPPPAPTSGTTAFRPNWTGNAATDS